MKRLDFMATQETAATGRMEWPNQHSCGLGHGLRVSTLPTACGCMIRGMFIPFPSNSPLQEAVVPTGRKVSLLWRGPQCMCAPIPAEGVIGRAFLPVPVRSGWKGRLLCCQTCASRSAGEMTAPAWAVAQGGSSWPGLAL